MQLMIEFLSCFIVLIAELPILIDYAVLVHPDCFGTINLIRGDFRKYFK